VNSLEKRLPEIAVALGGEDDSQQVQVIDRDMQGRMLVRVLSSYRTFWVTQEEMDALGKYFPALAWVNSSIN